MANEEKIQKNLHRATSAETFATTARLDELVLDPERYSHRLDAAFGKDALADLKKSLLLEGIQVPIEYFVDELTRKVVIKGHRRVLTARELAEEGAPNFSFDMDVPAIELRASTVHDRLVRSISDNCQRHDFSKIERVQAAKRMFDASVDEDRAAWALGYSVKSYNRDLLVARHPWMFQHVMDNSLVLSTAVKLLEAAKSSTQRELLKEGIDAFVADRKREIRELDRRRRAEKGEGLSDAEKYVKKFVTAELLKLWVLCLGDVRPLDVVTDHHFGAEFDAVTGKVKIPAVSLDVLKAPLEKVALIAATLHSTNAAIVEVLKRRRHEQDQDPLRSPGSLVDLDFVRSLGLDRIADRLADRSAPEPIADDLEETGRAELEPRSEQDVLDEVEGDDLDEEGGM